MVTLNLKFIVLGHDVPVSLKEVAASRNLPKDLRRVVAAKIGQGATKEATVAEGPCWNTLRWAVMTGGCDLTCARLPISQSCVIRALQ